ncbi:hypothetical protein J4450_05255 [Candidatus Micrarchaeota archaeon]|nr:hypothetical protein [Candidatus Micrarchaeota archaeon]
MKLTNQKLGKYILLMIISIPLLVLLYIFGPADLPIIKEVVVWSLFIVFMLLLAFIGVYFILRYKKEDKDRLQRMLENITAGIVGAVLVTFLDSFKGYTILIPNLSFESLFLFFLGIGYLLGTFVFVLGVSLFPVWVLLSYIEKD